MPRMNKHRSNEMDKIVLYIQAMPRQYTATISMIKRYTNYVAPANTVLSGDYYALLMNSFEFLCRNNWNGVHNDSFAYSIPTKKENILSFPSTKRVKLKTLPEYGTNTNSFVLHKLTNSVYLLKEWILFVYQVL